MADSWRANLNMDHEPPEVIAARLQGSRRRLLEAPALVIICLYTADLDRYPDPQRAAAERTMAVQSLGACVQTMLLTTYALGLDAGWMCAPLFCPETVVAALGLDPALTPHGLLAIGHAAADPKRRPRRPLETLIVWDDRER
jgi:F420 biosynthesis protein FbiB-like protein